ncbi:MAG: MarR family transcriptional regulator [Firmicutes bacterium]|nr:MarR family transcriptional regulator [Bacillota bacterium]
MEDVFSRHFARFGLTPVKFNALMQLMYAGDDGLALSELGERMHVTRANITGLVDRLERDGLVYREPDPRDRRSLRAKITPKAGSLLQRVAPVHGEFTGKVLSVLDNREKEMLIELLKKLQSGLSRY